MRISREPIIVMRISREPIIVMRISRAPHFRLSSASLPKSEIAVVLELFEE